MALSPGLEAKVSEGQLCKLCGHGSSARLSTLDIQFPIPNSGPSTLDSQLSTLDAATKRNEAKRS